MKTVENEFQLSSPSEPEFQLVSPAEESAPTPELVRERQLDFAELFGAVVLFSLNRQGQFETTEVA